MWTKKEKKKFMSLGIFSAVRHIKGHYSIIEHKMSAAMISGYPRMLTTGLILPCFTLPPVLPADLWPLSLAHTNPPHAPYPRHAFSTAGSFSNPTFFVWVFTVPPTSRAIHFTVKEIDLASVRSANGAQLASERKNGHRKWKTARMGERK